MPTNKNCIHKSGDIFVFDVLGFDMRHIMSR